MHHYNCSDIDSSKKRTIPRKAPPHLPYERSVGFASLRNFGRSISGIHARPLSKGGGLTARHKLLPCCVLLAIPRLFYLPNFSAVKTEGLPHHSFQNRTPPCVAPSRSPFVTTTSVCACFASALSHLAFRRVSVCVCLVGFASLQSPWAHTLKASLPCLFLPKHHCNYKKQFKRNPM